MSNDMTIETFAKIHKWLCKQQDLEQWERVSIMHYIADNHLNGEYKEE